MVLDNHGERLQQAEANDAIDKDVKVRQRRVPGSSRGQGSSRAESVGGKHKKSDSKARAEFQTEHFGKLKTMRTCFGGARVKCHLCNHLVTVTLLEAHASTCSKSKWEGSSSSLRGTA